MNCNTTHYRANSSSVPGDPTPLALDPDAVARFALKSDREKPEASRPVFLLKYLSVRQRREVDRLLAELVDAKGEDAHAALNAALAITLAGWRNLPAPFPADAAALPDALDDMLSLQEKAELAYAQPAADDAASLRELSGDDRKN